VNKHLFVVCANNSGSTLLHHLLGSCEKVVQLPRLGKHATSSEGHNHAGKAMPHPGKYGVLGLWTEKPDIFTKGKSYNWGKIKEKWYEAWTSQAAEGLGGHILVEKSPPNVLRASLLERQFENSYFIVMTRNPYATSEGLRRRHGYRLDRCAAHYAQAMKFQVKNLKNLKNVICITYEDLCDNQKYVKKKISAFLPELSDLSFKEKLSGHHSVMGKRNMNIVNLNEVQIGNLSNIDIRTINKVLKKYKKEMNFFNYERISSYR